MKKYKSLKIRRILSEQQSLQSNKRKSTKKVDKIKNVKTKKKIYLFSTKW